MTIDGQVAARSPADELRARLDEPQVAAALNNLLDHADLLAIVAVALDGFFSRADVIADTLAEAVGDLRGVTANGSNPLAGVDIRGLATSVTALSGPVVAATPALTALMAQISEPRTVEVAAHLGAAVDEARTAMDSGTAVAPTGALALLRALKDPDVSRGIGFFLEVAKAFGSRITS